MENYIEIIRGEHLLHCTPVPDIHNMQVRTRGHRSRMPSRKVVHYDNSVASLDQLGTTYRADISRAARNQDGRHS
jgi:hypothetical protein